MLSAPSTYAYFIATTLSVGFNAGAYGAGLNSATNKIYVTKEGSGHGDSVTVIDGGANTVTNTITIGGRPTAIGVNEATNMVYVARADSHKVAVINGITEAIVAQITICCDDVALSIGVNKATNMIYVSNVFEGQVLVIDGATNTVVATVPVGGGGGTGGPEGVDVNEATNRIYVAISNTNSVAVIDGATNTVVATVPVNVRPRELSVNAATNMIYVSNNGGSSVSVIDGPTNTVVATVPVGTSPVGIDADPSRNRIYLSENGGARVSVIDGATNSVITTVPVNGNPNGMAVNSQTSRIYAVDTNGDVFVIQDFDAAISASPSSRTVIQGDSTSYSIIGTLLLGPSQAMSLSVSGLPSGTTTIFTPSSISPSGSSSLSVSTAGTTPVGTYPLTITANGGGITKSTSVQLVVISLNVAPDCSNAVPNHDNLVPPVVLWPPNHKMKTITVLGVTDGDDDSVTITITSIKQDEPTSGLGDGDQSPDGSGIGTSTANIRVERSGTSDGRVYHISFSASDGNGGSCTGQVFVSVPINQNVSGSIDQGAIYDSTVP